MNTIPIDFQDLLKPETRALAVLATLMEDGSPQITPLWFSWDGQCILVNTAKGRTKERNMRNRPMVALAILDSKITTRYIQIRGKVIEANEVDADEHINALSLIYDGKPWRKIAGQRRVIFKILPEHVNAQR
jgi:PPOX class probable F420-dependent enzyme